MSDYPFKVSYRVGFGAILYLLAAWLFGHLSWPLVGQVFVYALLLPFAIVWSWPEDRAAPIWVRTLVSAVLVSVAAGATFAGLAAAVDALAN